VGLIPVRNSRIKGNSQLGILDEEESSQAQEEEDLEEDNIRGRTKGIKMPRINGRLE